MRKILPAVLLALTVALPAMAQLNLPTNYPRQWREVTKFTKLSAVQMGTGSGLALLGGAAYRLNATLSSQTGATVAASYSLPASSLVTTGRSLRCRIYGKTAANGNTKVVNFVFGGTTVVLLNAAANAKDFYADIEIVRTGANAQQINVAGYANNALLNALSVAATETETGALTVKVSVPATTGAADVVLQGFSIVGESG